ncbi:poly(rC)-binding protein 2 isoform X1 [Pogona vitticeps]|uniref:Poly(rC) binding protein 2 n=2 Tax=Iguania TaxID=8511 RepID=A0A803SVR7_ANOCA|nr:PREDICTED: poly(rC)-binding protein 2 isoform X1 [Anolis carolinensis]XP_016846605.1 PREDICTED: poly(rC)-binding protein 2 isoform X1 [Anolis carolinensis]XP_020640142.1 poly(rC)-binding protein 2 isoform X1 [Pogona vitticeps]XP_042309943.1 poly(rC)-binding protein 2 isoform X1 [Sceloporus undulatus]XP_060618835.1 poly(rC)-binding protein 2 isoform X1 [Anolis sagrei ordinatus]XP_060618836.1 poly(rC)-binding protein 2 isoform X1 [Anolis sagrei ordinatus]XP_060618838.1 poly(rC)-binding prote|eukprot:XP_016846604.1 PREDICTED: poly(rC)-binding protein 2 isoform X1 [Anolis carolinensis]
MDTGVIEGGLNVTLTIRLLMHGKEVGSIIGKKGESVKKMREESGARINISEGNCPERIITLAGPTNAIFKAFAMIIDKLEEDISSSMTNSTASSRPPVTLRLVVPASQCGSLIGKGGCKIKEIRESTGAQVQVAGDMLPNSTERAITIAGIPQSIIECVKQICVVMLESPPKGVTIPYRPKPSSSPVIFAGGQDRYSSGSASYPHTAPSMCLNSDLEGPPQEAYTIQGQYAIPQPDLTKLHQLAMQQSHFPMSHGNTGFSGVESSSPDEKGYWAGLDASAQTTSHELTIPNDLIGCIIGRQGAKINEIRQMSGAQIKIANPVEGSTDRQVTITGSAASISLAQYLINVSLESAKPSSQAASVTIPDHLSINLSQPSTPSSSSSSTTTPSLATAGVSDAPSSLPNPLPTAPCVSSLLGMKPVPLLALNVVSAAKGASTTSAVPCVTNKLKTEKQRFSPY